MVAQTPSAADGRVAARVGAELRTVPSMLAAIPARPAWPWVVALPAFAPVGAVLARLPASLAWLDAAELDMLPASAAIPTKTPTKVAISRRVGAGRTSGRRTLTSTPLPVGPPGYVGRSYNTRRAESRSQSLKTLFGSGYLRPTTRLTLVPTALTAPARGLCEMNR